MNGLISRKLFQQTCLVYQVRSAHGYWNKDWMPGPAPKNEKERLAAAKKYNLLPHEYEPYKEGEMFIQLGDYPKIPYVSVENKDVYYPWDIRDMRKNFGEPIHHDQIVLGEDRVDSHKFEKLKYPPWMMFLALAGAVGFLHSGKYFSGFRFFPPIAARQMPSEGVVHYGYNNHNEHEKNA